jgi:SSS family solute:Na+ symporter
MSLGIWYACTNQFYIQRCFGARSEWDARMGIVLTGVLKMCLPLLVVFPGMMAFSIYGDGLQADKVYTTLVRDFLPTGLGAVVLAAMAAAIMSTVSSVLNSASTIFTIDLYQRYINPQAEQAKLVRVGQWSTLCILIFATAWAPFILYFGDGLFIYIQEMGTFFAPSIGVIFVVGMLSKKATPAGGTWTLIVGTLFGIALKILSLHVDEATQVWMAPFLNRAFFTFVFSLILIATISRFTKAADSAKTTLTWNWSYARLPEDERARFTGFRNFYLWWGLWVGCVVVLFIKFH